MSFDEIENEAAEELDLESIELITFEELEAVIKDVLMVPDFGVIKLICALVIANRFDKQAVWTAFIAPSGGGKTALLDNLLMLDDVYALSMLTPNTFLSGMGGAKDPSLLPIINGKILLMKDFTSILSLQRDARAEVMSQLREIWDGGMRKAFGNGQVRDWAGKVSLIVASTQALDFHQQMNTHLGERFINYRIIMPDRLKVARVALENNPDFAMKKKRMQRAFLAWYKGIDWEKIKTEDFLTSEIKEQVIEISDLCTMARSGVIRVGNDKEVQFVPTAEMPTRMVTQLVTIAEGLVAVNLGVYMPEDMKIVYKCAMDSIPATNWMVIEQLVAGGMQTTAKVATALGYPTSPIRMYLENLAMLNVIKRFKPGADTGAFKGGEKDGNADRWELLPRFKEIILKHRKIKQEIEEEAEESVPDMIPETTPDFVDLPE